MLLFSLQGISQGPVTIEGPSTVEAAESVIYQFQASGLPTGYEYHSHTWSGATWANGNGYCGGPAFRGSTTVPAFNVRWGGFFTSTPDVVSIVVTYPNPFTHFIQIELPNLSEWRTWDIMDITGRMIKFGNISLTDENITIDTKDLNAGVYFIRIHDASGNAPAVFKSVKM